MLLANTPILQIVTITGMKGLLDIWSIIKGFGIVIQAWVIATHHPPHLVNKIHKQVSEQLISTNRN